MRELWNGAAKRAATEDFARAAARIGCSVDVVAAVWLVEASGLPFRADGSLERRFEPHKLAVSTGTWKTSAALSSAARERMFATAYAANPVDAMRATSWGGPQIMGFNHQGAGFATVESMVRAMAESEGEQLHAFASLILAWGLDGALRAHDWRRFAARYNGDANVAAYAARIEKAFQQVSGTASPVVLRPGDKGVAVRRLQEALGLQPADGSFGPETERAVRKVQAVAEIPVDGVVGARTWEVLEKQRRAQPVRQPATEDRIAQAVKLSAAAGSAASAVAALGEALPESTLNILVGGGVVLGLAALAIFAFQKSRGVA